MTIAEMARAGNHARDAGGFGAEVLARLAAAADPVRHADSLADLFSRAYERSGEADALRRALLIDGLRRTLAHAVSTTPHYRDEPAYEALLREHDWSEAADLSSLPIISRADLVGGAEAFLADGFETAWISHTAGSTGEPVPIHRASEEVRFQQAYFQRMIDRSAAALTRRPLVFTLPNVYHGVPTPLPSLGKVFSAGVTDDVLIADAARVLGKRYHFRGYDERISIISGLGFHVTFFTNWLFEHGIDPASFGIRSINITGAFAAAALRRFLSESWKATVFDRFTLTEIAGGATRVDAETTFAVDPYVLAEVVGTDGRPIRDGVGQLVMTSLYPFVLRQPVIRYTTGDLVRVRESDGFALLAFDFLGKTKNCIGVQEGDETHWVLHSADLNEAMAEYPDFRLYEWFANVRSAFDRTVGNQPLFRCSISEPDAEPRTLTIEAELRYSPYPHAAHVRALQAAIAAALRRANPALDRLLEGKRLALEVRFVPPGGLGDNVRFKI